jgi:hypothetical protein
MIFGRDDGDMTNVPFTRSGRRLCSIHSAPAQFFCNPVDDSGRIGSFCLCMFEEFIFRRLIIMNATDLPPERTGRSQGTLRCTGPLAPRIYQVHRRACWLRRARWSHPSGASQPAARPNILFIMTDQSPPYLSAVRQQGHPHSARDASATVASDSTTNNRRFSLFAFPHDDDYRPLCHITA